MRFELGAFSLWHSDERAAVDMSVAQRFFPIRHSNREWLAIALGVSALLLTIASAMRAHEHDAESRTSWSFRSYATFLTDTVAAAGLGPLVAPMRFSSEGTALGSDALAVRIGAGMADLSVLAYARNDKSVVAYDRHDTGAVRFSAEQDELAVNVVRSLVADADLLPYGRQASAFFRATEDEARRGGTISLGNLQDAARYALEFQPFYLIVGDWLESVRVAALRDDSEFLQNPEIEAEAAYAARLRDLSPSIRSSLLRLDWLLRNVPVTHSRIIARQSTELLTMLGD